MLKLAPLLIVAITTPAMAKCHLYSIWHYKFPQTCKITAYVPIHLKVPSPPPTPKPPTPKPPDPTPKLPDPTQSDTVRILKAGSITVPKL
jgi:hypothetical protein